MQPAGASAGSLSEGPDTGIWILLNIRGEHAVQFSSVSVNLRDWYVSASLKHR